MKAFETLETLRAQYGEVLPLARLVEGFKFEGRRISFVSPQGIFKPAILPEMPLSIKTVPIVDEMPPPYEDEIGLDGLIRYKYRGTDPMHRDNVGLRLAMQRRVPLVYFYGIVPGQYFAVWPVYIVGDDPRSLTFSVESGDSRSAHMDMGAAGDSFLQESAVRSYITVATQRRLHQQSFRIRVLQAYRQSCSICRLRHAELLEAAHILPDRNPRGEPWVSNGISLCKLHHAAFDSQILGIRPDLVIEIRRDILEESDGPLLIHGLQGWHNKKLSVVPNSALLKPREDFLEERYELFRRAG